MKLIILAAGQGSRLKTFTRDCPKCLVNYQDKPIIDYILEASSSVAFDEIIIVTGYKKNKLEKHLKKWNITFYHNKKYALSNMVTSLFCARESLNDDVIISYGDIVYFGDTLKLAATEQSDVAITIDRNWKALWQRRMAEPLDDAETLKLDSNGFVTELGKKPTSENEIEGQYMGLIKISKNYLPKIINHYDSMNRFSFYDGKDFQNMFMTSFLQNLIDHGTKIKAVPITGKWTEIDTPEDLQIEF